MSGTSSISWTYYFPDVEALVRRFPYIRFRSLVRVKKIAVSMLRDTHELALCLSQWPLRSSEALELHYSSLAVRPHLCPELIADLRGVGWRGEQVAAWMLALFPDPRLAGVFEPPVTITEQYRGLIDLARARCAGRRSMDPELDDVFGELSIHLGRLPASPCRLRFAPDENMRGALDMARASILQIYRQKGADAAMEAISNSVWKDWL